MRDFVESWIYETLAIMLMYSVVLVIDAFQGAASFAYQILAVPAGMFLAKVYRYWNVRRDLNLVLKSYDTIPKRLRTAVGLFFEEEMELQLNRRSDLFSSDSVDLPAKRLAELRRILFEKGRRAYAGVDSRSPSEYSKLFPNYLTYQIQERNADRDIEILAVSLPELRRDAITGESEFGRFYSKHKGNGIRLLHVDPTFATEEAKKYSMLGPDVSAFSGLGILESGCVTRKGDEDTCAIRLRAFTDRRRHSIREYLVSLNACAQEIFFDGSNLELRDRTPEVVSHDELRIRDVL